MNFRLIRDSAGRYSIKDANDKTIYICKQKIFSLDGKYFIYDENNLQLAEIKQALFSKSMYKLYMNDALIDEVIVSEKIPLDKYLLKNKKWTISSDITFTTYEVTDEKKNIILTMECNLALDPYVWDITINTTEKLLAIITAITILSISKK